MSEFHHEDLAILHRALSYMRENGPSHTSLGICDQSIMIRLGMEDILKSFFLTWPKFSGRITFPVPHPTLSPNEAYTKLENLWDRGTEYGRNRWELLDHCIAETGKLLGEKA